MEKVGSDQNDCLGAVREAAVFAASVHQLLVTERTVTAFGVSKTAVLHFMVQAVFFVILFLSVFQSMFLTGKAAYRNFGIPCRKVQNAPRFPQEDHWIAAVQVK